MATPEEALNVNNEEKALSTIDEKQIAALLENEVQTSLENIDPRPPRIKVSRESQSFLLPDGSTQKTITGTIVFHHKARGYWETEGQQVPTCSSIDGKTGINEDGNEKSCAGCDKNRFGSGKDGHGKACKEMRWLYVLQEGQIIPSRISLPPTSLGQFDSFVTALAQNRIAPIQKIVRLSLESTERRGFKYSVLSQPEVLGDVPLQKIPELIKMREAVVAAARKAGIEAEDFYGEGSASGNAGTSDDSDDNEPF